jgi:hypothetical protein
LNPSTTNMYATFVGTVPSGSVTNALIPGYNLVGSIVPMAGDLVTNSISLFTNGQSSGRTVDFIDTYAPGAGYSQDIYSAGAWQTGDPIITNVYQGFFFFNGFSTTNYWVENYSVQ